MSWQKVKVLTSLGKMHQRKGACEKEGLLHPPRGSRRRRSSYELAAGQPGRPFRGSAKNFSKN